MKFYLSFMFLIFCFAFKGLAQTRITGNVTSSDGKPLNATIKLKQSRQIALSDSAGNFTIRCTQTKDTLVITHIGYQTGVIAFESPPNFITVKLKPAATELNEITVSTGYYSLPQERATGSFDQLNEATLNTSVSPDIINRLKNTASGISFDERNQDEKTFSIRGLSTIYGNAQPLIVLDNFPYEGDSITSIRTMLKASLS
jgi:hypothetical protein